MGRPLGHKLSPETKQKLRQQKLSWHKTHKPDPELAADNELLANKVDELSRLNASSIETISQLQLQLNDVNKRLNDALAESFLSTLQQKALKKIKKMDEEVIKIFLDRDF